MDYYIPLIIYIALVSLFFRKKKNMAVVLTVIPLVLFWGTKVDFGPDYPNYLYKFETQHDMPISWLFIEALRGKFEPGFFLLLKIMPSFNSVVFITSTFLILSVYSFFNEFVSKNTLYLALFLWLFNSSIFNTFSAMRSSFVIAFFLLAIIAKTKSYNKTAILLTLLGAQFHMSGYLLLIFTILPFNFFREKREHITPFIFVFVIIALLIPTLFSNILKSIIESNQNLNAYEDHVKGTDYGLGFYLFSLFRLGFIIYILSLLKRNLIAEKYIWIAWLTIFCYLFMMMQGINIMYRFFNYLFLATVVFKCYVLKIDKTVASKIYVGLSVIYALYNFYEYMHSDLMPFYRNYHSFLF